MELADFLLARIAEDEAVARKAGDVAAAPWRWEHLAPPLDYGLVGVHPIQGGATVIIIPSRSGDMWPDRDTAAHIALHDPDRVLAECEAKRRIVTLHRLDFYSPVGAESSWEEEPQCSEDRQEWPCPTLQILALPYAAHPDYEQEWKP